MKYTLEQRLDIGRRIYEGELTRFQAAEEYGINDNTARNYMWLYRDTNHLPPKNAVGPEGSVKNGFLSGHGGLVSVPGGTSPQGH